MADYVIDSTKVKIASVGERPPVVTRLLAGDAIVAGVAVYAVGTEGFIADKTDGVNAEVRGIALNNAVLGQPVDIVQQGYVEVGVVATAGDIAVLSTAGKLSSYADLASSEFLTIIGVFSTDKLIHININASGIVKA